MPTTKSKSFDAGSSPLGSNFRILIPAALIALYSLLFGPLLLRSATTPAGYSVIGFAVFWAVALGLVALSRSGGDRSPVSIGFRSLSWKWVAAALAIGVLLSLLVPVLTLLVTRVLPSSDVGGILDTAGQYPSWVVLLSVLTAGVTEEIIFRGDLIERLLEATGNPWGSALLSLGAFILPHLAGWNPAHILGVVIPLGAVLTGLYMWKRNVLFVMIVHVMIDAPLFLLSFGA
jgi:membrane protease YdiL (CAAX protease family)